MENGLVNMDLHNHLGKGGRFSSFNEVIDMAQRNLGYGGIFGVVDTNENESRYEKFVNSPGYKRFRRGNVTHVPEKHITK